MSCKDCDKFKEEGKIAYYRWDVANIGVIGCEKHLREVFDALNNAQENAYSMVHICTGCIHAYWYSHCEVFDYCIVGADEPNVNAIDRAKGTCKKKETD